MRLGWWRSSGVGSQVQVPMFYDAHYLFPRPWTQEQAAPGIPNPSNVAFYGPNLVSQSFVGSADMLSMVELWLAGPENVEVSVSLSDDSGRLVSGKVSLSDGLDVGPYYLSFQPFIEAKEKQFSLTLAAATATVDQPVVTRTVGGDRLDGSLRMNEYNRPGNLALMTYASGWPGKWWFDAVGEQLLPSPIRLRLQQYKPVPFKGIVFPLLLVITAVISVLFLVLARPATRPSMQLIVRTLGWTIVLILTLFLIWQVISGRVKLTAMTRSNFLELSEGFVAKAPSPGVPSRLVIDLASDLWTAERSPDARSVSNEMVDGLPAIQVPANSRLEYGFFVPPKATLRSGIAARGQGNLQAAIRIGDDVVDISEHQATAHPAKKDISWIEVDLSPWSGQAVFLSLITESENHGQDGFWIMPQIETESPWLLTDPLPQAVETESVRFRFGNSIELMGYAVEPSKLKAGEPATVKLYWRPLRASNDYATVFVHLLDKQGQIVAQHDAQPVNNAYPVPIWQPGTVIVDEHELLLPRDISGGGLSLVAGLYDPGTLERWPVVGPDNIPIVEGSARLSMELEVDR